MTSYISWKLQHGSRLFHYDGLWWEVYHHALMPAHVKPCFTTLSYQQAIELIQTSRAWMVRYTSDPCPGPTEWYYMVIDTYESEQLSAKMRNQIKRGHRDCRVDKVDEAWLAENAYSCYLSSFRRYANIAPVSETQFKAGLLSAKGGPYEYYAVFVPRIGIVGYAKLDIEGNDVRTTVLKFNPEGLRHYCAYALLDSIIQYYVVQKKMILNNGSRSVAHATNMQDFLLKFGFKRQYCKLNVQYTPWLKQFIRLSYPAHGLVDRLPESRFTNPVKALHLQEKIRRTCAAVAGSGEPLT